MQKTQIDANASNIYPIYLNLEKIHINLFTCTAALSPSIKLKAITQFKFDLYQCLTTPIIDDVFIYNIS
eukprot:15165903-Ditylum_brightwellii.AAC.1